MSHTSAPLQVRRTIGTSLLVPIGPRRRTDLDGSLGWREEGPPASG
jgi:hypothetical protein